MLLFDYRGYGGNPGSPSEQGWALDVRAAHRFLVDEQACRRTGSCTTARAWALPSSPNWPPNTRPPVSCCGPRVADLAAVGQVHYPFLPVRALLRDRFPTAEYVGRITVPITVVYGSEDSIVPAEQSRAVATAAAGPCARSGSTAPTTTTSCCSTAETW